METDPVCGMDVDISDAHETAEYEGVTFHFCSKSCRETFQRDPERFAGIPGRRGAT